MRPWWKNLWRLCRPLIPNKYQFLQIGVNGLLQILAIWAMVHNRWDLYGMSLLGVILWNLGLRTGMWIQYYRSASPQSAQPNRRGPEDGGSAATGSGVPRRPIPPPRLASTARAFPEDKQPGARGDWH